MKTSPWFPAAAITASSLVALALVACGGGGSSPSFSALFGSMAAAQGSGAPPAKLTPVAMRIANSPVPVTGSDGVVHVVYEVELSSYTGTSVALQGMDVLDAASGSTVATLGASELASRLVVRDRAAAPGSIGPSQVGLLYLHLKFDGSAVLPKTLAHRLNVSEDGKSIVETGARIAVAAATTLVLGAPLRGSRYIAGDGCCDAVRHVRATLPLNADTFTAQRFAIDWEQLDEQGRIYVGNPALPSSYVIYGKPIYAVADGIVVTALDGLKDTPPGALPPTIPIEEADGNHVVLDLGGNRFATFAHMKPGSVLVRAGETVRKGQLLGEVGTSGNSSEPHLHFQVTDGPSPLASNGLPYLVQSLSAAQRGVSTAAYDQASGRGVPVALEPVPQPGARQNVMPMDLWIVDFPS